MKVAVICELAGTARQGGTEHAMLRLAAGLSKANDVDVFSYSPSGNQLRIKTIFPLTLRLAPFIRDLFVLPIIGLRLLKKLEKDYPVIVLYSPTLATFYKPKSKLIAVRNGILYRKFYVLAKISKYKIFFNPITQWIAFWLEKTSTKKADKVVVIMECQKQYIQRDFGILDSRIKVIPNGVDTELFKPRGLPKKNQIIFVGRATTPKGFFVLLEAASLISADILVVVPRLDEESKKMIELQPNVRFVKGASPAELAELYAESKAFLLPSYDEEQPLTVIEAMACGLPVVVSKAAASDVVDNERNGFVLEEITPNSIALACGKLLDSSATMHSMGQANRVKVESIYSLSKNAEEFQQWVA